MYATCQISAYDGDGDAITYSLAGAGTYEHFAIDWSTGRIDVIKSLDYERTHERRLGIIATDNGTVLFFGTHIYVYG